MTGRSCDIAIVGGGLAGGLTALALHRADPGRRLLLIESGAHLGGNHRWSWFASDIDPAGEALLADLPVQDLGAVNRVRFPGYERQLRAPYRSLASADFDAALRRLLPPHALATGEAAEAVAADGVMLASGERIVANTVIDCRSFAPSPNLAGGWQLFCGRSLHTAEPHGVTSPLIMDAAVAQLDGYRFVYVLPLGERELFIEDTYYADEPRLDADALRARLAAYAEEQGWRGEWGHEETGLLPVVTGGDFAAWRASLATPGVTLAGARGGFFHPLTSYTLPLAVANAVALAAAAETARGPDLAALFAERAARHWRATRFYRDLGRMLFDAAAPAERWRIFARFYRLPEPLIERFYAARSTPADKIRLLTGKPPVPIPAAVRALLGKGRPLVHGDGR